MLRQASQFEAVLKSAHRATSRNFVARLRANDIEHARLGIIAGRKAAPRAVDRNRVKRLIREVFRAAEGAIGPCDITIQLRRNPRDDESKALRGEIAALMDGLVRRAAKMPNAQ